MKDLPIETRAWYLPPDVHVAVTRSTVRVFEIFNAPALASDPTPGRWRRKTAHEHVFASLSHIAQHLRGRREEDHLAHAAARLLLAMASD